jgi:hemoglobin
MEARREITSIDDIRLLVNTFYSKVQQDALLGPVFHARISDRWAEHLEKMYRFWQTLLLGEHTYQGHPFAPHALLPVAEQHFDRWLALFNETTEELFTGPKAAEAKLRALNIARLFELKVSRVRAQGIGAAGNNP